MPFWKINRDWHLQFLHVKPEETFDVLPSKFAVCWSWAIAVPKPAAQIKSRFLMVVCSGNSWAESTDHLLTKCCCYSFGGAPQCVASDYPILFPNWCFTSPGLVTNSILFCWLFKVKGKCVFNKCTIKVCISCCWRCLRTSAPSPAHLTVSLYLCSSGSNVRGESRAWEGRRVS